MNHKKSSSFTANNKKSYRSIPIGHMLKFRGEKTENLNQKLNDELLFSYEKLKMTEEEVENRRVAFNLFKLAIEKEMDCKVEPHGSFRTGTMVFGSDIDLTVLIAKNESDNKDNNTHNAHVNKCLGKIVKILEKNKLCTGPILHIKHARIPIVKCVESNFNCKIDIVINQYNSIDGANFVIDQIEKRPYLKYLIILIKYFLKRRNLSEVIRGGLCSYGQFLLILNFIQLHPLSNAFSLDSDDNNTVFLDNFGTVLLDFFQFYGTEFPFERATISVLETRYKPNRESQVNIEDPINPGHNVASGCTAIHTIREIFTFSYKIMSAAFTEKVDSRRAIGELWLRLNERELIERKNSKPKSIKK
jgi:non-canonical poly(A) RNA polymerase PAPD5/7